ncbi:MAG: rubrerythrin family protein [Candidatus Odinarchaeota archaeon]
MSIVIQNLKEAINGESNAKRKYELYAEKAKEENLPEVAHLFEAISSAEAIHIKNHIRALKVLTNKEVKIEQFVEVNEHDLKQNLKDTKTNLIDAINGETYETKKIYKDFVKSSKKEGSEVAELSFSLAKKAEKIHAKLFSIYLKLLENNKPIEKRNIFVCQICGNVEFEAPPSVCPICEHSQKFFKQY